MKSILELITEDTNQFVQVNPSEQGVVHSSWYCGYCKVGKKECTCVVAVLMTHEELKHLSREMIENEVVKFGGDLEAANASLKKRITARDSGVVDVSEYDTRHNWFVGVR